MIEDIGLQLRKATIAIRDFGLDARIPDSDELYKAAQEARSKHPSNPDIEHHWRAACLIHGAVLAARDQWPEAARVYATHSFARGGQGSITPLSPTSCKKLAAMMAVGEAVARIRANRHYAEEAASEAVRWLTILNQPQLNRWHGVALIVIAHYAHGKGDDVSDLATYAKQLLDPHLQPELAVLVDYLSGAGDGYVKRSWHRRRLATFQAAECLYLFR